MLTNFYYENQSHQPELRPGSSCPAECAPCFVLGCDLCCDLFVLDVTRGLLQGKGTRLGGDAHSPAPSFS